jgi:hypothetical protein
MRYFQKLKKLDSAPLFVYCSGAEKGYMQGLAAPEQ